MIGFYWILLNPILNLISSLSRVVIAIALFYVIDLHLELGIASSIWNEIISLVIEEIGGSLI